MRVRFLCMVALAFAGTCSVAGAQSLYSSPSPELSLYQDRTPPRASRPGDILTVLITENTSATNSSNVATKKQNKMDFASDKGTGVMRFIPGLGLVSNASTDYSGQGSTARQQQFQARVSVTVVGLKPNGDLMIEGSRTIGINGEQEVIHLSGEVDPLIIPADNTIDSYRISNLQISYKGKGAVTQGARPGVFVRLFNWIF